MKTINKSILVIAILFLSGIAINTSYALKTAAKKGHCTKEVQNLAPVTPLEADFYNDNTNQTFDYSALAPTTPIKADFNDDFNLTVDFSTLAPRTPTEADFE
jgi:hypothetical protein